MRSVRELPGSHTGKVPETAEQPHPAATSGGYGCNLQAALAGLSENEPPGRFMGAVNTANSALGNRAFLRFVSELHAARKQQAIHDVAARGLHGPGRPLTHRDTLQQAFGHHDVSGMREHVGPETGAALDRLNADGFTSNGRMALANSPDLHTQAHEAAHGVQQAALGNSMVLQAGTGRAGDRYERHADAVADAVVAGRDAQPVLDRLAPQPVVAAAGPVEECAPVQMVTRGLRKLIPEMFRFKRLTPATYAVSCDYPYQHEDTGILMKNYRQAGSTEAGFSRPFSVVNRLAIAHLTGDDTAMLKSAYDSSWWPAYNGFTPQRPSLQYLGLLLDEAPARLSGGRFLRYTSATTGALSEGDHVVIPTFHPAELIRSPKMFGLAFDFLTRRLHFGVSTDVAEKVILELVIPDNHKLALPYGGFIDARIAYAPCLINPWVYTVDKISVIGAGFPDAPNATTYDEREHALVKFIRLKAMEGADLPKTISSTPSAPNLYTGRNIPLKDLLDVYAHLFHHRAADELPPIDTPH